MTKAFNAVRTVVLSAIEIIGGIIRLILAVINGDWSAAWQAAKDIVNAAVRAVLTAVSAFYGIFWSVLKGIITAIINAAVGAAKAAYDLGARFIRAIWEAIKNAPKLIADALRYLFTQAIFDVANFVINKGAELWSYVVSGFTGAQAAQPLTVAPPVAPAAPAAPTAPTPPKPERANAFGNAAGSGKKARSVREPVAPIERAERADEARRLEQAKDTNERLLTENKRAYDAQTLAFSTYLARRIQLEQANIDLEINARREAGNRVIKNIGELNGRLAKSKGAERNAVRKELDDQTAELIKLDNEITILRRSRADVMAEAEAETTERLRETARAAQEARQRYLELTGAKRAAASVGIGLEFDERQAREARDLAAAQGALAASRRSGDAATVEAARLEVERLQTEIARTAEIRRQMELQADFSEAQDEIAEIERKRGLALDDLNRKLAETGATDDIATERRRELMRAYQKDIDKVVAVARTIAFRRASLAGTAKGLRRARVGRGGDGKRPARRIGEPRATRLRRHHAPPDGSVRSERTARRDGVR